MSGLIAKFPSWTEEQLETSRANAIKYIVEGAAGGHSAEKIQEAQRHLEAIHIEFDRRLNLARKGEYKPAARKEGILARLGYHVGTRNGVATPIRRKILELAFKESIPVSNPLEMEQWGEAHSEKRLHKLAGSLAFFVNDNKRYKDERLAKAIIEWQEDLDWLKKNYFDKASYGFAWPKY